MISPGTWAPTACPWLLSEMKYGRNRNCSKDERLLHAESGVALLAIVRQGLSKNIVNWHLDISFKVFWRNCVAAIV
jgi:hypothetical protein